MAWVERFLARFEPPATATDWRHGVDISGHQPNYTPTSEDDFGFIKLSQGVTYQSDEAADQVPRFVGSGVPCGGYHFAGQGSAQSEAGNYLDRLRAVGPGLFDLPHVLDLEALTASGAPWRTPGGWDPWALEWCERVEDATGQPTMIYTAAWWTVPVGMVTDVGGRDLWVANYAPAGATAPWLPAQWDRWAVWQWTSGGPFGTSLDRNVCSPGWLAAQVLDLPPAPAPYPSPTWAPPTGDAVLEPFTIEGGPTVFVRNTASGRSAPLEQLMPRGFQGDPMDVLRELQAKGRATVLVDLSANANWALAAIDAQWSQALDGQVPDPVNPRPAQDR